MKLLLASAAFLMLTAETALAAEPIGDWLVKDGYAHIRIDNCAGKLWGIVAWEKEPGKDDENPDPAKKGRATLGMPIIMGFTPAKPNKWEGEIYNSQNGKMYSSSISMVDDNTLDLEGCLFTNFLCQTQKWTRVKTSPPGALPLPPPPAKSGPAAPTKGSPTAAKGPAAAPVSDVCARIPADNPPPAKGATK